MVNHTSNLPIEILGYILSLAAANASQWHWLMDFRQKAAVVDNHWNAALYSQRDIWRWLTVQRCTPIPFIVLCLERSKNGRLALDVDAGAREVVSNGYSTRDVQSRTMEDFKEEVLPILAASMANVDALMVECDKVSDWRSIFDTLVPRASSKLEELTCIVPHSWKSKSTPAASTPAASIFASSTRLLSLNIHGVHALLPSPTLYNRLTRLQLHHFEGRLGLSWDVVRPVLHAARNLLSLTLHDVVATSTVDAQSIVLLNLAEFDFKFSCKDGANLGSLIEMPAIRTLRVETHDDGRLDDYFESSASVFVASVDITLQVFDFQGANLAVILSQLVNARRLDLSLGGGQATTTVLLLARTPGFAMKKLERLKLPTQISEEDANDLFKAQFGENLTVISATWDYMTRAEYVQWEKVDGKVERWWCPSTARSVRQPARWSSDP
ncbi:hypothetical protein DFH09DRAFT_1346755 [Mycena vulgaris]|nr:hypothetical protein DFH09DRAFT_1346755 [Mycena vulgaris]